MLEKIKELLKNAGDYMVSRVEEHVNSGNETIVEVQYSVLTYGIVKALERQLKKDYEWYLTGGKNNNVIVRINEKKKKKLTRKKTKQQLELQLTSPISDDLPF